MNIRDYASLLADSEALKEITSYAKMAKKTCTNTSDPFASESSSLFLSISAAADYFASNEALMQNPLDVVAEIFLDPYLMNIIPQSLVPVGAFGLFILALAISGSNYVYSFLQDG